MEQRIYWISEKLFNEIGAVIDTPGLFWQIVVQLQEGEPPIGLSSVDPSYVDAVSRVFDRYQSHLQLQKWEEHLFKFTFRCVEFQFQVENKLGLVPPIYLELEFSDPELEITMFTLRGLSYYEAKDLEVVQQVFNDYWATAQPWYMLL